jgi:DNA-directed RNA polymerase specialized sigma24 family protein
MAVRPWANKGNAMVANPTMDQIGAARDRCWDDELPRLVADTGDRKAQEQLCDLTIGTTYALALRVVGERGNAEEVVEDAQWQVCREADRYDAAPGRPLAWLLTICRSRPLGALRRRDPAQPGVRGVLQSAKSENAHEN